MCDSIEKCMCAGTKPLQMALNLALEKFVTKSLKDMAYAAGADYDESNNCATVVFIGKPYSVGTNGDITPLEGARELSDVEKVIIIHYLITATGRELTGNLISYRELRGIGANAISSANEFSMAPLERAVGDAPKLIYVAEEMFGAEKAGLGDASIRILALPRVPITYVVWEGEDNIIPPAVNLLFDSTASDYLPNEDLSSLSTYFADMIIAQCGKK